MRVVIVKARTVREHEIAFDFFETQRPFSVDLVVGRFIRVLEQTWRAKAPRVAMRIFEPIIPLHVGAVFRVRTDQLDRFATTSTEAAPRIGMPDSASSP